jgi:hypothetical protein
MISYTDDLWHYDLWFFTFITRYIIKKIKKNKNETCIGLCLSQTWPFLSTMNWIRGIISRKDMHMAMSMIVSFSFLSKKKKSTLATATWIHVIHEWIGFDRNTHKEKKTANVLIVIFVGFWKASKWDLIFKNGDWTHYNLMNFMF